MYTRSLNKPNYSFFLFGPRGTGKTTWLRNNFKEAYWKNLLLDADYLPLLTDTSILSKEVEALDYGTWIVIDEVQRIPALLNQVHNLISKHGQNYKFALSGSSARKLKRLDSNLLAGRAIERTLYPLTSKELDKDFNLEEVLSYGSIPTIIDNYPHKLDVLTSYVGTYLKQEIQQEALVEDIGSFSRFLKVAAIMNGENINISNIARDSSVARSTAERYFDILVDTLIGFRLPGWQPQLRSKERITPKFYFFDTGIVRACTDRIRDPLSDLEIGKLLETFILHELRSAISYLEIGGSLYYWQTGGGVEVDFIWERGDRIVAIEVKSASTWRRDFSRHLKNLDSYKSKMISRYVVYRGDNILNDDGVEVLPIREFLSRLHSGNILGSRI